MLKNLDRALAVLLSLGAIGHTFGSIVAFRNQPVTLLWALCASLLIALVGGINLLRTWRPSDYALAWLSAVGALSWLVVSVAFGIIIGNLLDPRVIPFAVMSTGLLLFSMEGRPFGSAHSSCTLTIVGRRTPYDLDQTHRRGMPAASGEVLAVRKGFPARSQLHARPHRRTLTEARGLDLLVVRMLRSANLTHVLIAGGVFDGEHIDEPHDARRGRTGPARRSAVCIVRRCIELAAFFLERLAFFAHIGPGISAFSDGRDLWFGGSRTLQRAPVFPQSGLEARHIDGDRRRGGCGHGIVAGGRSAGDQRQAAER